MPHASRWSQFPLFLCTPSTWSCTWGTVRATRDLGMDIRAPALPYEFLGPATFCWILTFSSISQAIIMGLAGFAKLQVTTPYPLVPSNNNYFLGSNLWSTLHMWSSSLHGLISPQHIDQFPHLSHNQHSVSVSPHHLNAQLPSSFPIQTVLHIVLLN